MSTIDRRSFLRYSALTSVAAAGPFQALMATAAQAKPYGKGPGGLEAENNSGYGPLQPAGPEIALPAGFSYVAFGRTGEPMSDGNPTPADHDGMAAFGDPRSAEVLLVRNHELSPGEQPPVPGMPTYDPAASGGTTNLVFNTATMQLEDSYPTLAGTVRNCAGGPTPWGTWLSCEETFSTLGDIDHGYVFDVDARATSPVDPVPLTDMGRFVHEAVAVDPDTGIIYETEDRGSAGFYRFLANVAGDLVQGGRLQMLKIKGRSQYDTRTGQKVGKPLPVEWVDIDEPNPAGPDADSLDVFNQGFSQGAAVFARLEGCWYGGGSVYFDATSGGDASLGQIWEYTPRGNSGGQLTLVFESPSPDLLEAPDNITVSPQGSILICEDGSGQDLLRGITPRGQIFDFGANILNGAEFAGATFSPDGEVLFVNIQSPGITFAITGPFENGAL